MASKPIYQIYLDRDYRKKKIFLKKRLSLIGRLGMHGKFE